MMNLKYIITFSLLLSILISCNSDSEKLETTHETFVKETPINSIAQKIDENIDAYEKIESLRFSKETEQYEAVKHLKEGNVVLISELFSTPISNYTRNFYYNNNKLVLIKEIGFNLAENDEFIPYEHNIYYYEDGTSAAFKVNFNVEVGKEIYDDMGVQTFNKLPLDLTNVNIDKKRFESAFNQQDGFEMKFGEFLIIEPQSYLILENEQSDYDVALYIIEGDSLLDDMFVNPEKYKGKTIQVDHEFQTMNGVERTVYMGGKVID